MKKNDLGGQPLPEGIEESHQEATPPPTANMEYLGQLLDAMTEVHELRAVCNDLLEDFGELHSSGLQVSISEDDQQLMHDSLVKAAQQAGSSAASAITTTAEKTVSDIRQSRRTFQEDLQAFQHWCRRWLSYFIGAVIWALLASGAFVWQCTTAHSDRKQAQFQRDSLQLWNDIAWDYIEKEVPQKKWDHWQESNKAKYQRRFLRLDSLRRRQ